MTKWKYTAILIRNHNIKCSFSSTRVDLVRTKRPRMSSRCCDKNATQSLELLFDFKPARSLEQDYVLIQQINIQSKAGWVPWKRSKDQGIHPPVALSVDVSFKLIKNVNFLCASLVLPRPKRQPLFDHSWSNFSCCCFIIIIINIQESQLFSRSPPEALTLC